MTIPSITREPHVFARRWYKPEEIHAALQWTCPAFGRRMGNTIPEDVRSREFAVWLAEQMSLAMAKGAELAIREMKAAAKPQGE